jgi:hypothetical protein
MRRILRVHKDKPLPTLLIINTIRRIKLVARLKLKSINGKIGDWKL